MRAELAKLREEPATKDSVNKLAEHSGAAAASRVRQEVEQTMQQLGQTLRDAKLPTEEALQRCRRIAEEYDRERLAPPGPARTFELSRIVAAVRGSTELQALPEEEIRSYSERATAAGSSPSF